MKKSIILFLTIFAIAAGAAESVAVPQSQTTNEPDAKNFLGFSLRIPHVIQPFFYETAVFSAKKLNQICGKKIPIKKMKADTSNLRYFLPTFGFFSMNGKRDTFGLRFGLAERNALAVDTGANLALFISDLKQINGLQICPFVGKTNELYGFQILPFLAFTQKGYGIQTSLNSVADNSFHGLQLSAMGSFGTEVKGFQIGGFTALAEHCAGVQISGLANLAEKEIAGLQISGFGNQTDRLNGVQIGLYNRAEKGGCGLQIGLLNYMEGALVPWFPLFNIKL